MPRHHHHHLFLRTGKESETKHVVRINQLENMIWILQRDTCFLPSRAGPLTVYCECKSHGDHVKMQTLIQCVWGLRFCPSNKHPDDVDTAVCRFSLEYQGSGPCIFSLWHPILTTRFACCGCGCVHERVSHLYVCLCVNVNMCMQVYAYVNMGVFECVCLWK